MSQAWNYVRFLEGRDKSEQAHILESARLLDRTLGRQAVANSVKGQARYPRSVITGEGAPRNARPIALSLLDNRQQSAIVFPYNQAVERDDLPRHIFQQNPRLLTEHEVTFNSLKVLNLTSRPAGEKFIVAQTPSKNAAIFRKDTESIIQSIAGQINAVPRPMEIRPSDVTLAYVFPGYEDAQIEDLVSAIRPEIVPFRASLSATIATSQGRWPQ